MSRGRTGVASAQRQEAYDHIYTSQHGRLRAANLSIMLDLDKTKGAMGILSALAGAFSAIRKLLARDAPAQTVSSDRSPGAHLNNSGQITLTHSTLNVTTSQAKQWVPVPQWELKTTGYGGIRGDWNCKIQANNLGGVGHGVEVSEKESGFFRRYGSIRSGGKLSIDLNFRNGAPDTLILEIRAHDANGGLSVKTLVGTLTEGGYVFSGGRGT